MTIPTVNPLGTAASQASGITPANMQISETGFLQLITAQMQDQNPLDPADPTQFLSQIEGLSEVSSLQGMQTTLQTQQLTNGAALLGQQVLVPLDTANLASGGAVTGAVTAPEGASSLTVTVSDSSGTPVRTFEVAPASSGLTGFTWDGTTDAGAAAPAGTYTISVNAAVDGASESVAPLIQSQVSSVTVDPSTQALEVVTSNGTAPMSSIVSVL